eukprot:4728346-Pleurochrysis_carterae.AAC.1
MSRLRVLTDPLALAVRNRQKAHAQAPRRPRDGLLCRRWRRFANHPCDSCCAAGDTQPHCCAFKVCADSASRLLSSRTDISVFSARCTFCAASASVHAVIHTPCALTALLLEGAHGALLLALAFCARCEHARTCEPLRRSQRLVPTASALVPTATSAPSSAPLL